jgi:hypothetical protein
MGGRSTPGGYPRAVQRIRQFNAWMGRGFNTVYAYVLLAVAATFFRLVLRLPGGWNGWFFVEFFVIFAALSWVRELRARRRR